MYKINKMKNLILAIALLTAVSCSKNADKPQQQPTVYIQSVSTFLINEPGGAQSTGINYTVVTRIPSLQLIRDIDGVVIEAHTEVQPGNHTTYDRNNYSHGAKYHFLVNNKDVVNFIIP